MVEKSAYKPIQPSGPISLLAQEYQRWKALLANQPPLVQRFFEGQARLLADALLQKATQVNFRFPDQINAVAGSSAPLVVPAESRDQMVGGLLDRLTRTSLNAALCQRLDELETSANLALSAAAGLLRFATTSYLVVSLLPSGRSVEYRASEGEEIPSLPLENGFAAGSAITAETDAIVEEAGNQRETDRGTLQVPFVPAARRFFLPQWVALDEHDQLLVGSLSEAEACLASTQQFVRTLHTAVSLAPYMVADDQYQAKRYGILGQLVNQGRALARYETRQIIETIKHRAAANDLNRGLSLSLPYFDDQILELTTFNFQIIPAGRIMFVPAFVVRACQQEQVKVAQDTRLSPSTRKHLLEELQLLAAAFDTSLRTN